MSRVAALAGTSRTWADRVLDGRDRLLASPRFQHAAAAFPLTRWIARRRARELFDLCAGFVYSQALLACVRLKLFDALLEHPRTVPVLSRQTGLAEPALQRLLDAAESLRLVCRRSGGRYGLGALGAAVAGNPGIAAMVEHHAMLYADLRDPLALLRGERSDTALGAYWPYAGEERPDQLSDERVQRYTALMSASQTLVAEDILDAWPFRRHRCLLDVGGGDGTFLCAAGRRAPDLKLMLFDLPAVARQATARFARAGLSARAQAMGGDFTRDMLPRGADLATLVRVIHDHDDDRAMTILRAVRAALLPGGTLLVAEPMAGATGAQPMGAAYFGFYLLAMGSGRARHPDTLRNMLTAGGFVEVRQVRMPMPLQTGLMAARVPST